MREIISKARAKQRPSQPHSPPMLLSASSHSVPNEANSGLALLRRVRFKMLQALKLDPATVSQHQLRIYGLLVGSTFRYNCSLETSLVCFSARLCLLSADGLECSAALLVVATFRTFVRLRLIWPASQHAYACRLPLVRDVVATFRTVVSLGFLWNASRHAYACCLLLVQNAVLPFVRQLSVNSKQIKLSSGDGHQSRVTLCPDKGKMLEHV